MWKLFERVFGKNLTNKKSIINFLKEYHLGIVDLILSCRRSKGGSSDSSLYDIEWNSDLQTIIQEHQIKCLIFTSKSVERWFKKLYPMIDIPSITLLSPSSQTQRALGSNQAYLKWKALNPYKKPIDFIELSYRKALLN